MEKDCLNCEQLKKLVELADKLAHEAGCQLEEYPECYEGPLHNAWLAYNNAWKPTKP